MNSISGGIVLMLLIALAAGVGLNGSFTTKASDRYISDYGSVRLD